MSSLPFWHPDDPKFGNCPPPMTDEQWQELFAAQRQRIKDMEAGITIVINMVDAEGDKQ